jgi:hypothetical protein
MAVLVTATIDWKGVFPLSNEPRRGEAIEALASLALGRLVYFCAQCSQLVLLLQLGEAYVVKLCISIDRVYKPNCPKRPLMS